MWTKKHLLIMSLESSWHSFLVRGRVWQGRWHDFLLASLSTHLLSLLPLKFALIILIFRVVLLIIDTSILIPQFLIGWGLNFIIFQVWCFYSNDLIRLWIWKVDMSCIFYFKKTYFFFNFISQHYFF
jgi:hypothetical protein